MLPTLKRIQDGDIVGAPSWMKRVVIIVNSFFQSVYKSLNGELTFSENIKCQILDIEHAAPFAGLRLPIKLTKITGSLLLGVTGNVFSPPTNVLTGGAGPNELLVNVGTFTAPVVLRAHQEGQFLIVDDLSGLVDGETYKARILLI